MKDKMQMRELAVRFQVPVGKLEVKLDFQEL
jgi:hypothetical protein